MSVDIKIEKSDATKNNAVMFTVTRTREFIEEKFFTLSELEKIKAELVIRREQDALSFSQALDKLDNEIIEVDLLINQAKEL